MFGTRTDGLPKVTSVHLGSPGRLLFAGLKLRKQTLSVRKFPFPELIPINASGVAVGSLFAIHGIPRAFAGVPQRTFG